MSARILGGEEGLEAAVSELRAGAPVAIPTETVYGLAADALNREALERVFEAKGRPATNPLIVHVLDAEMAKRFVRDWDERAARLSEAFWPGPLTFVLPKAEIVPDIVTAGGPTVAVRAPDHPVARAIIERFGGPLAAPSANRSNGISPTSAEAVFEELGDRIDVIIEGGACEVGLESTVLDLSVHPPVILRPGHVGAAAIEAVLGVVLGSKPSPRQAQPSKSPGQMKRHYSPHTPLRLIDVLPEASTHESKIYLLRTLELPYGCEGRRLPTSPELYARALYAALRWADQAGATEILIEAPPDEEAWRAVRDRLERASAGVGGESSNQSRT